VIVKRFAQIPVSAHQLGRHRRGFTLIEMLIVIAIILILMSIGVSGFRSMELTASRKQTITSLAGAEALVRELNALGALNRLEGPSGLSPAAVFTTGSSVGTPGDVNVGQGGRTTAVNAQQKVMLVLLAAPKNAQIVSALPPQSTVAPIVPNTPLNPPALADAWGNPLMYVPSGGMSGLTVNGVTNQTVRSTGGTALTQQDHGYWMSAGPDGNFTTYDDNLISVVK